MRIQTDSPLPDYDIAPGLRGHRTVEVIADPGEWGLPYSVTATMEARDGKYVVTRIVVEEAEGGPTVQRGELAKISVEPFIRAAASKTLSERPGAKPGMSRLGIPGASEEFLEKAQANGLTDDDLPELAALYRWIRLQEGRPTAVLASALGLSTATVKRWLAKAVEAGYLTQAERTK
ncbi:hypothetical protein [Rhodococcus rhodochrous]|uniref:hypothetical protein n=1 Tax=Rhodococcus rhodochrous TaxID=1829 RepID=UPI000AFDF957|nr:hypothetical protein [Rhodococcus rhodochrous]